MINSIKNTTNSQKLPLDVNAWKLQDLNGVELIHLELNANEKVEKHANIFDVIFYVLEGEGYIEVDNDIQKMSIGDCIGVKKNILRGWLNKSNKLLKLLVVKTK